MSPGLREHLVRVSLTSSQPVAMVGSCTSRIDPHGQPASPSTCPRKGAEPVRHYVITRADTPRGVSGANLLHAAGESASPRPKPGTHAVWLEAKDETHLKQVAQRLFDAGIEHHCVFECDDDPDYPGQLMAIGLYPRVGRCKEVSSLPLAR